MILVEINGVLGDSDTNATFYFSDAPFVTGPADDPAHEAFIPALLDPGTIGINLFSDGRTSGGTRLEVGEIVIANADGAFDAWTGYGFDGREIVVRWAAAAAAYPSGFATVFRGTMESVEATWDKVTIRLRDKQFVLSRPVLTTTYAGDNALPDGLEGTADDLKGKVKPRVYGVVANITPTFVNTSKLTHQVSDGAVADITAVYDQGLSLTKGADYATSALLQAAAPAAGSYITCFAEGYFRLGSSPAGEITADVTQGAAASDRTVAQILKQLALAADIPSPDINAADVTALDTANSAVVGIYLSGQETFAEAMDQIAASVGAFYYFDSAGALRMGRLTAPSGTAVSTFHDYDTLNGFERYPAHDNGIPVWSVTVNHTRNWTVQTSDIAGAVTAARRAYLGLETRSEIATDPSVINKHILAGALVVDTLLTSAADAATEAARLLALYGVHRDLFDVPVPFDMLQASPCYLTDVVDLDITRFSLAPGTSFRMIGIRFELAARQAILSLWG